MARKITLDQLATKMQKHLDGQLKSEAVKPSKHGVIRCLLLINASNAMCLKVTQTHFGDTPKVTMADVRWNRNRGIEDAAVDMPTHEAADARELELTGNNLAPAATPASNTGTSQSSSPAGGTQEAGPTAVMDRALTSATTALNNTLAAIDLKEAKKMAGQVKMHGGRARKAAEALQAEYKPQTKISKTAKAGLTTVQDLITKATAHVESLTGGGGSGGQPASTSGTAGGGESAKVRDVNPADIEF